MNDTNETLKAALKEESVFAASEELMDRFLDAMEEIRLQPKEILTPLGKMDDNVYVIKSGILSCAYFDGIKKKINAFGMCGTLVMLYHPFYMRKPSVFELEACCETVVLRMSKRTFESLLRESHEFAQWMLDLSYGQLFAYEMKLSVINGTAEERFMSLINNRPEIIRKVAQKTIASYLGITPQYLSHLRRKIAYGRK